MRGWKFGLALAGATAFAFAPPVCADAILWKQAGGWDISFYPGAEGCQAFVTFEADTSFFIGFDATENPLSLDVTLLDQKWSSLEDGKTYDVTVKFGDESPWNVSMTGLVLGDYPGLNILIDAGSDQAALFVEEFQRETRMEWSYRGTSLGRFTLRGSRRAFNEVIACQQSYNRAKSTGSDPFAAGKKDPFAN